MGLTTFYGVAGILHLAIPAPFLAITPYWVPHAGLVIAVTGICELGGAAGLWPLRLRRFAGIGLAVYAASVYPANIKHAIDALTGGDATPTQWAYHIIRQPLQPILIWLALYAANVVTWPLRNG